MDAPHLVDVIDKPRLEFKRHSFKYVEADIIESLSGVPYGVLHIEDVRSFYHYKLEDLGTFVIFDQYRLMCDKNGVVKEQFKKATKKSFHHALNYIDDFDDEHVRYVLSRIHDQFMWLDRPYKITKGAIHTI